MASTTVVTLPSIAIREHVCLPVHYSLGIKSSQNPLLRMQCFEKQAVSILVAVAADVIFQLIVVLRKFGGLICLQCTSTFSKSNQ